MPVPALLDAVHGGEGPVHRARHAVADLLFRVYALTGERPSPAVIGYMRPYVECEQAYEAAVIRRLDTLAPLPGPRPAPAIQRVPEPPPSRSLVVRPRRMRARVMEAPIGAR